MVELGQNLCPHIQLQDAALPCAIFPGLSESQPDARSLFKQEKAIPGVWEQTLK